MINQYAIKKLNPCKDRFDNYLKFYAKKSHTKAQFLGLKNITHEDKLWVAFRLMTESQVKTCAIAIARSVLHIFESKYPNDKRPRLALDTAEKYLRGECTLKTLIKARDAAHYATYAAHYASYAAAYAAHYAATATANAAANAAHYAASYATTYATYAAHYATYAAHYATTKDKKAQEKLIRTIILKHWKGQ